MHLNTIKKILNLPGFKVISLEEGEGEYHIYLEKDKRFASICSFCKTVHFKGYHSSKATIVEDLPISGHRVFLHLFKELSRCPLDNRIHVEFIDWLASKPKVTQRFEEQVYRLTSITTNQEAGWYLGLDDEKVYRIDKSVLERKALEKLTPVPAAINISVDEVSYKKYYHYLTNVIDVDIRKVIWNSDGRTKEVFSEYYKAIGSKACENIESVALDGAQTYISPTKHYAINALIVYDKFHLNQKLNNAIDTVRKDELRKARKKDDLKLIELTGCKQRFVLLKKKSKLSRNQKNILKYLCECNEPILKGMILKEQFLSIYENKTPEKAREALNEWIEEAKQSSLISFRELSQSFERKKTMIVNWFKRKISSAISEGFNNKIKRLKRMAYGYRDVDYFRLKIHQHCGLLNPKIAT